MMLDQFLARFFDRISIENVAVQRRTVRFEEGWECMQKGITKLKNVVEGTTKQSFCAEDFIILYTSVYNMCTQNPPNDHSHKLYDKYGEVLKDYIKSTVLPSLREKHDDFLLREFIRRWSNYKVLVVRLQHLFHYLDRYFIVRRSLPCLNKVGITCFRLLVYQELNAQVKDAVISLIDQEREGVQIDRALLKNILDIFVEIGLGSMEYYDKDFEAYLLEDTAAYYSQKASAWIEEDSCPDYMLKAEECIKLENDRVSNYLHPSSEQKLLEKVQNELLVAYVRQILDNEHSGCHALLRDHKVEDLSRMYRLFSRVPHGLEPVSQIVKQYVTAEGTSLLKHAEDNAINEKVLITKVVELWEKCLAYVNDCFQNHSLFRKALKEAFEEFRNEGVAGSFSSELLAAFCNNIQ